VNHVLGIVIISQLLFASGDLLGRYYMHKLGFHWSSFISFWFLVYMGLRSLATLGQLYVFTQFPLGKTMALFAAANLVLANLLGYLFLGELLPRTAYVGIMLAIVAFFVVAYAKA
jgi:uncharacterized membrane protein